MRRQRSLVPVQVLAQVLPGLTHHPACMLHLACLQNVLFSGTWSALLRKGQSHKESMTSRMCRSMSIFSHIVRFAGSPAGAGCKEPRCCQALPCSKVPVRAGSLAIA